MFEDDDPRPYSVVRNGEEQYSIWPADREPPGGWERDGFVGQKPDCLTHIAQVWTDLRPKSLRDYHASRAGS
jgi:MbtH protein